MFENLNEVRRKWVDSEFVLLHDVSNQMEKISLVIPSQMITNKHLSFIRSCRGGQLTTVLGDKYAKFLEFPQLESIFNAMTSRYQLVNVMMQNFDENNIQNGITISISHIDHKFENTNKSVIKTLNAIGDFADDFVKNYPNRYEFINKFGQSFYIPGTNPIVSASIGLLQTKISTAELCIALSEISSQAPAICYSDLMNEQTGDYLNYKKASLMAKKHQIPIIESNNLINLWRSIKKIAKSKIAQPRRD